MAEVQQPNKGGYQRKIFVVDGVRTPFLKARGRPGPFAASDLAVAAGRVLLERQPFKPKDLGEVVIGCVAPAAEEANIGRVISLRLGCGKKVPAWTVARNCASGMQALDSAAKDIACGRHELVLAGGTEAMSRAPLIYNKQAVNWFADLARAKTAGQKLKLFAQLRPGFFFAPQISLLKGLTDHTCGLNMGHTAENLAHQFNITRAEMDAFSVRSHLRVASAQDEGRLDEITALYDQKGKVYAEDDGVRRDSSSEKLAKLKPVFDRKFGRVTAGNSSQVTDGACALILASEAAVKKYQLPVLGEIVDVEWAALSPEVMGLGPVFAATPIMQRHQLTFKDVDYWEINEAFATQVLACVRAWADTDFCKTELGLAKAMGKLDEARLNVDGGAVALGHPVGTSGARIVLHLLHTLRQNKAKQGIASICIGGGQGGAMLLRVQ